jgi:leucyl-tRNA synthetase
METVEKIGVQLPVRAIHPISGEKIPIFVANFVLISYGTGAIMAVPWHDQRDWEFARKYDIQIRKVVRPIDGDFDLDQGAYVDKTNTRSCNSGEFDGLNFQECFDATAEYLVRNANGERATNYRLRDWGVSRQRYWGCPVPVIYDEDNQVHPVPDESLPVILPEDVEFQGVQSPIRDDPEFLNVEVPGKQQPGRRETDTFDTFVESAWYFARFCCPDADKKVDERANYWLPVDHYIGGIEHAVLHLLYARLYHKLMRDFGLIDSDEPFTNLLTQGMVLKDGTKMSKSVGNVVDPQEMIDQYGADTVRLFILFASPPQQTLEWKDEALAGAHRFLNRLWNLVHRYRASIRQRCTANGEFTLDSFNDQFEDADSDVKELRLLTHTLLQRISNDFERNQFNTAIAACMELVNGVSTFEANSSVIDFPDRLNAVAEAVFILVRVLAPIVPHICHELWIRLGMREQVIDASWPTVDESALVQEKKVMPVQVNGRLRGQIEVAVDADRDEITNAALENPGVLRHVEGKPIKKTIIVPEKLVNIVT